MKLFNPRRPKIRLFNEFKTKIAKKSFPLATINMKQLLLKFEF